MEKYIVSSLSKKFAEIISVEHKIIYKANILKKATKKQGILVGDSVLAKESHDKNYKDIVKVLPRTTVLQRQDPLSDYKIKSIAANIDILLIVSTATAPKIKPEFIFRAICLANLSNIKPLLVINKKDLLSQCEQKTQKTLKDIVNFLQAEIECHYTSCTKKEGIDNLNTVLSSRTFAILGQSGVGKSHLVSIMCDKKVIIGDLNAMQKGKHTTTQSQAIYTTRNGLCIDTPGIQELSYNSLYGNVRLHEVFPGIIKYLGKCKFSDCIHINTPGCELIKCVKNNKFPEYIYDIYCRIHES